jgi:c-di-GMP-binding flagellar brake protein YcgR
MILPEPGQQVALQVAHVGQFEVVVDKIGKDSLVLALLDRTDANISVLASKDATVAFSTARGVYQAMGTVRRSPLKQASLRFELQGKPKLYQRREYVRIEALLPVTLFPRQREAEPIQTQTLDIGGGGMRVVDSARLRLDETVGISLDLGDGGPRLPMSGIVLREVDAHSKAIRITRISDPERERLIRVIFERQRVALRRARGL